MGYLTVLHLRLGAKDSHSFRNRLIPSRFCCGMSNFTPENITGKDLQALTMRIFRSSYGWCSFIRPMFHAFVRVCKTSTLLYPGSTARIQCPRVSDTGSGAAKRLIT